MDLAVSLSPRGGVTFFDPIDARPGRRDPDTWQFFFKGAKNMFDSKLVEQLEKQQGQIAELIQINRSLLTKIESQNKCWITLADHVAKLDNSERPAFGVSR